MNHDRSRELYDRALSVLPGGVNSPVRATQPYPAWEDREGAVVQLARPVVVHAAGFGAVRDMPDETVRRDRRRERR